MVSIQALHTYALLVFKYYEYARHEQEKSQVIEIVIEECLM